METSKNFKVQAEAPAAPNLQFFIDAGAKHGGAGYDGSNPDKYRIDVLSPEQKKEFSNKISDNPDRRPEYMVTNTESGNAGIHTKDGSTIGIIDDSGPGFSGKMPVWTRDELKTFTPAPGP